MKLEDNDRERLDAYIESLALILESYLELDAYSAKIKN